MWLLDEPAFSELCTLVSQHQHSQDRSEFLTRSDKRIEHFLQCALPLQGGTLMAKFLSTYKKSDEFYYAPICQYLSSQDIPDNYTWEMKVRLSYNNNNIGVVEVRDVRYFGMEGEFKLLLESGHSIFENMTGPELTCRLEKYMLTSNDTYFEISAPIDQKITEVIKFVELNLKTLQEKEKMALAKRIRKIITDDGLVLKHANSKEFIEHVLFTLTYQDFAPGVDYAFINQRLKENRDAIDKATLQESDIDEKNVKSRPFLSLAYDTNLNYHTHMTYYAQFVRNVRHSFALDNVLGVSLGISTQYANLHQSHIQDINSIHKVANHAVAIKRVGSKWHFYDPNLGTPTIHNSLNILIDTCLSGYFISNNAEKILGTPYQIATITAQDFVPQNNVIDLTLDEDEKIVPAVLNSVKNNLTDDQKQKQIIPAVFNKQRHLEQCFSKSIAIALDKLNRDPLSITFDRLHHDFEIFHSFAKKNKDTLNRFEKKLKTFFFDFDNILKKEKEELKESIEKHKSFTEILLKLYTKELDNTLFLSKVSDESERLKRANDLHDYKQKIYNQCLTHAQLRGF